MAAGASAAWIRKNMPQTIHPVPQLITEIIGINHKREPFGDIRVLAAINLAISREVLSGRIKRNGDVPAYGVVPPGTANYPGGVTFDFVTLPQGQRTEKARALMHDAGYGENRRLKTSYMIRATTPGYQRAVAAAIQQMLAQVYIDIVIVPNDMQVFYPAIQEHDFHICQAGWVADFNDASNFLDLSRSGGGNNWGEYANPRFDALLDAAQRDTDLTSRGEKLAAAEKQLLDDHACMPLWFWTAASMAWPYAKGFEPNIMDYHRSRWVSIDQAARIKQFA